MKDTGSNFSPASSNFRCNARRRSVELARCGALERKDRLLLVADREHRAHHAVARAGAGGEFGDDVRDDVPLPRAGVLRLVDQHMVDAAVELVMHPAGGDAVRASPASCRSDRHSRAGRVPASRGGNSPPPRSRYAAAPRCGRGRSRRGGARSGGRAGRLPARTVGRSAGLLSQNFFVTTDLRGVRSLGEEHVEIFVRPARRR